MKNLRFSLLLLMLGTLFSLNAATTEVASKWKSGVDLNLQVSQNYITDNWYNGGNSNFSAVGGLKGWWNYEGKSSFYWSNLIELKYGVSTNFSEDKVGQLFHVTDDKTKYSTKVGYGLGKGWNVTWNGDLQTSLFNNFKIDTWEKSSAFASPVRFNTGIGFDYKYSNAEKKIDVSVLISPYAFKLVYVNDTTHFYKDVDGEAVETSLSEVVGIAKVTGPDGVEYTDLNNQLKTYNAGSSFEVNYRQEFNDYITLASRLSFYTDYKGIEVDWEIIGDFKLYKLLSARVTLNPRYDSTVDEGWNSKIQFKEFVSIGLAYRFEK